MRKPAVVSVFASKARWVRPRARRLAGRVSVVLALALLVSLGVPAQVLPGDGSGLPLSGLWAWLRQSKASASALFSPRPRLPVQELTNPMNPGRGKGSDDTSWLRRGYMQNGQPRQS